ncbi:hypothetical protein GIB67_036388 [Kingdonia uniflora]|uniref:t-SNARE coiled-coil homology domain-containing protein n=1 Tax=Kingdonia uniflora TaxID=39325 RepID=A0A7J7L3Z0_9MAGN|nr:hypothetical protein GIB67_036388 [Kingdonia uniflora]
MSSQDLDSDAMLAVASVVFQINTVVSTFQRLVNTLGTPKDTPELREKLALVASINLAALKQGKEMHSYTISRGLSTNPFVCGSLVELYSKYRDLVRATMVINQVIEQDTAAWNAIVDNFMIQMRNEGQKTRLHVAQLVRDTSAKLKQASETDQHSKVSASKKITDAKLAKDFQAVLKEFQKAQRLAAQREIAYAPYVPKAVLPSSYTAGKLNISSDKNPEHRALLVEARRQKVLLLDNEIVFNEAITEEEEQRIQEIQQQFGEVNEIFKNLAVLIHDQGITIDDLDSFVDRSHAATEPAKIELAKASKTQNSNSSLVNLSPCVNVDFSSPADLLALSGNLPALGDTWGRPSHPGHSSDSLTNQICRL